MHVQKNKEISAKNVHEIVNRTGWLYIAWKIISVWSYYQKKNNFISNNDYEG